jgi:hypothetical protein
MLMLKLGTLAKRTFQNGSIISKNKKKTYESLLMMMEMLKLQRNLQL